MTVLVTGATGFIGGAVAAKLLAEGHTVRALVRDPTAAAADGLRAAGAQIALGDLTDAASLAAAVEGADKVFHAAARLGDAGRLPAYRAVNVEGTRTLLDASAHAGVRRFVFVSSPSALMSPDGGDQVDIDESTPYPARYFNHYCATKAAAEELVLRAPAGMSTCALRPRAVWGPGDRGGPIATVLERLAKRRLPDLDPGRPVWVSLCYIDHCVDASLAALSADDKIISGHSYFIADEEPIDLWPMLRRVADEFDLPGPGPRIPAGVLAVAARGAAWLWRLPGLADARTPPVSPYTVALLTRSASYDTSAARRDLGVRPSVGMDEGLARYKQWVQGCGDIPR